MRETEKEGRGDVLAGVNEGMTLTGSSPVLVKPPRPVSDLQGRGRG